MRPIVTDGTAWSVCQSVCHNREPYTETASGVSKEACARRVLIGATWQIRLNRPCVCKITLTTGLSCDLDLDL